MSSLYPEPWRRIEAVLKMYSGWSRMFSKSAITYDEETIIHRQSEIGFWVEWARARADEQFREEVENCCKIYRAEIGIDRHISQLRIDIAKALISEKWKPKIGKIKQEIKELRKKNREEREALSNANVKLIKRRRKWRESKKKQRLATRK